jgi:hypothetical protein
MSRGSPARSVRDPKTRLYERHDPAAARRSRVLGYDYAQMKSVCGRQDRRSLPSWMIAWPKKPLASSVFLCPGC